MKGSGNFSGVTSSSLNRLSLKFPHNMICRWKCQEGFGHKGLKCRLEDLELVIIHLEMKAEIMGMPKIPEQIQPLNRLRPTGFFFRQDSWKNFQSWQVKWPCLFNLIVLSINKDSSGVLALNSLFIPVCWTHVHPWCYRCRRINTSHGALQKQRADPACLPKHLLSVLLAQFPGRKDKDMCWVFYQWCTAAASCLPNDYLYSYRDVFNKGIQAQKELLLGNTQCIPQSVFIICCVCPGGVRSKTFNSKNKKKLNLAL